MQSVKLHLFSQTNKIKLLTIHTTHPISNPDHKTQQTSAPSIPQEADALYTLKSQFSATKLIDI